MDTPVELSPSSLSRYFEGLLVDLLEELPTQVIEREHAHAEEDTKVTTHITYEAVPVIGVVLPLELILR